MVQRNTTGRKRKAKEMLLPPIQQTTGTSSTTLSPYSAASETHALDDCPGQML